MTGRRDVLDLYRSEPVTTRIHTALRWLTCPFVAVSEAVPRQGRILEIGCGHGLFSSLLALQHPSRQVVGTDVDGDKIRSAQRAASQRSNLSFAPSEAGDLPCGPWDAIAIVDVLYLIDAAGQERLLAMAADQLAPGGVLVVKEMAQLPHWKFRMARWQERLSVQVLNITEGNELTFVAPARLGVWLNDAGLEVEHRRVDRGFVHPHHMVVGRRSA